MFSNPIIKRYQFSQLRPQNLWIFGTLYAGIVLLIFFINMSIYTYGQAYSSSQELYASFFVQFTVLQMVLSCLIMPMNSSSVVPREIGNKSYDFFRMLPLSSFQKATGIMVGRNLVSLITIEINFLFCAAFGMIAGIPMSLLIQMLILWIMTMLAVNFSSLLFSILSIKNTKSTGIPLLLVAIFAFGPIFGGLFNVIENKEIHQFSVFFLNIKIPLLYLISGYIGCIAAWLFLGILRRFKHEYESLFSFKGAFLFTATYLVLVYALFHNRFFTAYKPAEYLFAFFLISLFPVLFVPIFSVRSYDIYVEKTRLSKNKEGLTWQLFLNSNLCLGIVLFSLWALLTLSVATAIKASLPEYLTFSFLILSSYFFLICLLELYVVFVPKNEKIGYLLAFLGGMYLVFPLILSGVFENDYLSMFSPIGMIINYQTYDETEALLPVIITNSLFCIVPVLLIGRKYSGISKLRSYIETAKIS